MKLMIIYILLILSSCGYPDIDTVPNFKSLDLTKDELFDLCELSSNDKKESENCIKDKNIN